jgi:hypothetical protein
LDARTGVPGEKNLLSSGMKDCIIPAKVLGQRDESRVRGELPNGTSEFGKGRKSTDSGKTDQETLHQAHIPAREGFCDHCLKLRKNRAPRN